MSNYKEIHGQSIQVVSSDPSNPTSGQLWYNSTSSVLKVSSVTTAGSWASGGNMSIGRQYPGGLGTQTAGLAVGGTGTPNRTVCEEYGGASWTTGGSLGSGLSLIHI